MEIPENFISLDVVAGINGERSKRKKKCTDIPSMYRPSANEQVYVSAVADRVNVGKDEGLRFSGWTELGEGGKRERRKGGETRENRRICIAGTGIRGRRKKFRAHRVSARECARGSVYLCDTLRIRVNDT